MRKLKAIPQIMFFLFESVQMQPYRHCAEKQAENQPGFYGRGDGLFSRITGYGQREKYEAEDGEEDGWVHFSKSSCKE